MAGLWSLRITTKHLLPTTLATSLASIEATALAFTVLLTYFQCLRKGHRLPKPSAWNHSSAASVAALLAHLHHTPGSKVAEEFVFSGLSSGLGRYAFLMVSFPCSAHVDSALGVPQWSGSGVPWCLPSDAFPTPLLPLPLLAARYFGLREWHNLVMIPASACLKKTSDPRSNCHQTSLHSESHVDRWTGPQTWASEEMKCYEFLPSIRFHVATLAIE